MEKMSITQDILDALLSPTNRSEAEHHFNSVPLIKRASSLISLLLSLTHDEVENVGRMMLAAVLLRRDISSIGGLGLNPTTERSSLISLLRGMAEPLMDFFVKVCDGGVKRQICHVVAELCLSLSLLEEDGGKAVMKGVLGRVGPGCSAADLSSIRFLSTLAQRSPISLWQANEGQALESLLLSAIAFVQQNNLHESSISTLQTTEALIEAVCYMGLASEISSKFISPQSTIVSNKNEMYLQIVRAQTESDIDPKKTLIVPNCPSAALGRACLPVLLQILHKICINTTSIENDEKLRRCFEHLSHCASTCPSLLAGDLSVLHVLIQVCLSISRGANSTGNGTDGLGIDDAVHMTQLSALEVLASLTEFHDVRRILTINTDLLKLCLVGGDENHGLVKICAELIVKGVDDDLDSWASDPASLQDDASLWEEDDVTIYAESLLESFLRSLGGGSHSLPVILPMVENLLSINHWKNQRGALSILKLCLNATPLTFSQHIPVAVETAVNLSCHPCARVQFQAIELLGALCHADGIQGDSFLTSHSIEVRKKYGGRILQMLTQLLSSSCTKISSHACLAIVSYCRGGNGKDDAGISIDSSFLLPFMNEILMALASGPLAFDMANEGPNHGTVTVLVRAIAAVACLAEAVGEEFAPFYGNIMPGLMSCVQYGLDVKKVGSFTGPLAQDLVTLRGAAVEAATIVGQAVGGIEGMFSPDAEKLMSIILPLLQNVAQKDDKAVIISQDQLLAASARIAVVMGKSYGPFVPSVLPHLLRRAKEEADVSITDGDEAGFEATKRGGGEYDEDSGLESITVAMPGMGLKKLVLNTLQIQEKSQSARAIYEHANALGSVFGPYSNDCFDALLPLIHFKYSAEVRATASQALGPVFSAACDYVMSSPGLNESQVDAPGKVLPGLLLAMAKQILEEDEGDSETLFAIADAMSEICYSAFKSVSKIDNKHVAILQTDEAKIFIGLVMRCIGSCLSRRANLIEQLNRSRLVNLDCDQKAEFEELLRDEAELLTALVDSIGYTLKSLKENFVHIFAEYVAPAFGPLLTKTGCNDVKARLAAVCLFDDCIEHCGAVAASKYASILAEGALQGICDASNDGDMELKQASVYGVSQIARHAPRETLSSVVVPLLNDLASIATLGVDMSKDEVENLSLVENASSAIASLCLFKNSPYSQIDGFDKVKALEIFIHNLPLKEDEDEAKYCHKGLCELVESGDIDILSQASVLFNIFGQIAASVIDAEDLATPDTISSMTQILTAMQNQLDGGIMQQAFSALSPEAQNGINMLMETSVTQV